MTIKKHKKHPPINRPNRGEYGRNEIGLLGAPCDIILKWIEATTKSMSDFKLAYVDAEHHPSEAGLIKRLTDKISHHYISYTEHLNKYDQQLLLDKEDLVFVNCNHFNANRQIVFCTDRKKDSLQRKLEKLTDVRLVVLEEGIDQPFDFLLPYLNDATSILRIDQIGSASKLIKSLILQPEVKGLILAGGRSMRMGEDKARINYHGMSQVDFVKQTLDKVGIESFVSCRREQGDQYSCPTIYDAFNDMGPFGAILSAFKNYPNVAWMVVACDMPFLKPIHFQELLNNRDISKTATCYHNPDTGWPDPLITLWEPKAYSRLLEFMSLGYNCPRKVLINSHVQLIKSEDKTFLTNANSPIEKNEAMNTLKKTKH